MIQARTEGVGSVRPVIRRGASVWHHGPYDVVSWATDHHTTLLTHHIPPSEAAVLHVVQALRHVGVAVVAATHEWQWTREQASRVRYGCNLLTRRGPVLALRRLGTQSNALRLCRAFRSTRTSRGCASSCGSRRIRPPRRHPSRTSGSGTCAHPAEADQDIAEVIATGEHRGGL